MVGTWVLRTTNTERPGLKRQVVVALGSINLCIPTSRISCWIRATIIGSSGGGTWSGTHSKCSAARQLLLKSSRHSNALSPRRGYTGIGPSDCIASFKRIRPWKNLDETAGDFGRGVLVLGLVRTDHFARR